MIDKQILYKRLADLLREVERIEYSHTFTEVAVEQAKICRRSIELLLEHVQYEKLMDDLEEDD